MAKTLKEFRLEFIKSNEDIADVSMFNDMPEELIEEKGESCNHLLFRNEDIAIDYVVNKYGLDKNTVIQDLHELERLKDKYGKEKYLLSTEVFPIMFLHELIDGTYILTEWH